MPYRSQRSAFAFVFVLSLLGFFAVLVFPSAHAAPAGKLPPVVSVALERGHIPVSAVAIWVQPVDAKQPVLAINAGEPMNPASVMKVVTTFAALEQLGPERSWKTRIAAGGPIRGGVLAGDLYVIGDGDPVLTYERLWRLLRRLRMLGLASIEGDIVLDRSALLLPAHDSGAFDGRGLRPYNSAGDGLLMHFNAQELALFPGSQPQEPVRLVEEPPLAGLVIDNQIVTSDKPCEPWRRDLDARREGDRLVLIGSLPASCGPRIWATAPLAPADFDAALLRALWHELGGALRGAVREGVAPEGVQTLIADDSAPLAEIVRTMNKWSNNVIARQLLAQLGRDKPAPADAVSAGVEAAYQRLSEARIDISGLVIENGAGLSRKARIRADSLGALLIRAWQRPWMPEFLASLPVLGRDGTTRRSLVDSPARGYAHLKTGTIKDVKAIAGYVLDQYGRRHAVVMMVNHPAAANSGKAQDALIEWVWTAEPPLSPRPARGKR
ncbi:MAG: D-alanyl-D-alanine carboxypeptidase/D-alanyl-D-alanine-endopeptidase [Azoarcus sp.]|jgi:D-alanyl-D-alanine carboxypeptidase/D-alanyl-D-alanine-endopeptidase (penicillin-binding protein 4)|nr:D-alanyl-D-alanine carboxypeptidase/D-alanyl-D-alanine-endopeptidase [Azoarcus sp.]